MTHTPRLHRLHRLLLAAAAGAGLFCTAARADGLTFIANPSVTLSAGDMREVFTGEKQVAGGTRLVPVDNASAQADFLATVIKLDAAKYTTVWTKKSFRDGLNPPSVKATDAEVIDFVKRTPGAVGYVKSTPGAGVNVVK